MATPQAVMQAMDESRNRWQHVPASIDALRRHFRLSHEGLGLLMGFGASARQQIQNRLSGSTKISPWELAGFAELFGVPEELLFEGPEASLRWVLDHPAEASEARRLFSEQPRRRSGWTGLLAGTTAA